MALDEPARPSRHDRVASPYRAPPGDTTSNDDDSCPDGDIALVVFVLWLASVARVVIAGVHRETFGVEATLAAFAVIFGPTTLREPVRWMARSALRRRRRSRLKVKVRPER